MRFDKVYCILHRADMLSRVLGNFNVECFLKSHYQFDLVEAVRIQIIGERRCRCHGTWRDSELIHDGASNSLQCFFTHLHLIASFSGAPHRLGEVVYEVLKAQIVRSLAELAGVAGLRWVIETCFCTASKANSASTIANRDPGTAGIAT